MTSPLSQKLAQVRWGEFSYKKIFNRIVQGRRLKKDDQIPGKIPFIMAGTTNTGVANYISNPVSCFPANSITIDIFGNVFYRNFEFGAGDDTGVYWNDKINYSREAMIFFASTMAKSLKYKFSYGKKLRSSQSHDFKMKLPVKDGEIDFEFIKSFVAELEAERIAELEAYLLATGLKEYILNEKEQKALKDFDNIAWGKFRLGDLFEVKSYTRKFDANKVNILEKGNYPYIVRMSGNNGQKGYINSDIQYLNEGNTISFGQDTATMFYQEKPYLPVIR
ncbi:MAG: restriction endonuclease subunit S [Alistipes senegalensis]|nr:restriction endonuclease subunit S [Oxalobacter formigenes]MCM1280339.1 restriction endonuclease subunit S [Alistipes senegalensis]